MTLATIDLSGRPTQVMIEDGSSSASSGVLGVDVTGRVLDGEAQTVVQILLDTDRADFDPALLDGPLVAELRDGVGTVVAREPFDHDRFRRQLHAERESGTSVTRGVLVLTDGELPPPWVRLAFLPVPIAATIATTLAVRRTTVAELVDGVDQAYARGDVTDNERQAVIVAITQRHPDAT